MDLNGFRRVVTDQDEDGRSRILIDGGAAKMIAAGGAALAEIWSANLSASSLMDATDILQDQDLRLEPAEGAVKVRWFTVAPDDDDGRTDEEKRAAAAFAFNMVGAPHAQVDTRRHPMMHKTETLDVIILIKGAVDLLLDEGAATPLKPGDVVIQRATNHAWANHGEEPALLVAVLISAPAN